jgi:hypothetical protein
VIAVLTIFALNLVEVGQILDDSDRNSWRCADEPKCNGQFLNMVTHMKYFSEMLL